jgi:hypothetical protein
MNEGEDVVAAHPPHHRHKRKLPQNLKKQKKKCKNQKTLNASLKKTRVSVP